MRKLVRSTMRALSIRTSSYEFFGRWYHYHNL